MSPFSTGQFVICKAAIPGKCHSGAVLRIVNLFTHRDAIQVHMLNTFNDCFNVKANDIRPLNQHDIGKKQVERIRKYKKRERKSEQQQMDKDAEFMVPSHPGYTAVHE